MRNPLDYQKASGIALLGKFLPDATPFERLDIIRTVEEWDAIKDKYADFAAHRTDFPIGAMRKNIVTGTSGLPTEIPSVLKQVQEQSQNGVVLLMQMKKKSVFRYLYDGGFNALFLVDDKIIIEFVGKAFDGHELTQGLAVHERYIIPWDKAIFVRKRADLMRDIDIEWTFISQEKYAEQYEERLKFLINDCHYKADKVRQNVPREFQVLNDSLIENFMDEIVFPLIVQRKDLLANGLRMFCVQGNFVNSKVQPWEIFTPRRWI